MPLREREDVLIGDTRRKGIYYCAECGRLLQRTNAITNVYLECNRGRYENGAICSEIRVSEKCLQKIISSMIKVYINTLIQGESLIKDMKYHMVRENKAEMTISDIDSKISKLLQTKMGLYERYRENSISKEEYLLHKSQLTIQIEELEDRKVKIVNGIGNKAEQLKLEERLVQLIKDYKEKDEFSDEAISQLVSKVIVRSEEDICIVCRFKDIEEDILGLMLQQWGKVSEMRVNCVVIYAHIVNLRYKIN